MTGRNRVQSLAASPTMVGAITTLVVIVAVFLAYNANNGLPFVPVYRVSAEMCNSARLGPNNEVRIGGNRVGVVESIETVDLSSAENSGQGNTCVTEEGNSATTAAKLNLKLDESAKPLPTDSTIRVRYRSSFGLKYLEIVRGDSDQGTLPEGGTLPIAQAEQQTEFDDVGNTFDTATRENSRAVLEGFGNAFAGRGASLNQAIEALNPLFSNLKPVSRALADPTTDLARFFPELADAARIIAPVAEDQAEFFGNAATAFAAISSDPEALRDTISEAPPTLREGIQSLPVQEPFLRHFAEFSHLLRPGVRDLRASLPVLNGAIATGAKTLPKTVQMNEDLEGALRKLEELVDDPHTKISITRLEDTFDSADSAGQYIAPFQTVCGYWNYWFQYLTEHFSGEDAFGLHERLIAPTFPGATTPESFPRNALADYAGAQADGRYSSIYEFAPPSQNALAGLFDPLPANDDNANDAVVQPILHGGPYGPSGTEQAPNCQAGQYGYGLGQALSPGQSPDNPSFGISNISKQLGTPPLGRTDLFLEQDGTRVFWDSP
jgi:phospholipid/cholesterol/gamma-HCH transport system substrate-binding protein